MKKIIMRALLCVSAGILLISSITLIIVAAVMNKNAAVDNAQNLLGVLETQMLDGNYTTVEDYEVLVTLMESVKDIRVTVMSASGVVLADTDMSDSSIMENHLNRKEVREALEGKNGIDTRMSSTFNIRFLYVAKIVAVADAPQVILRVAVPLKTIDSYLWGTIYITIFIFIAILIVAVILSNYIAQIVDRPFCLIKEKLEDIIVSPSIPAMPIRLTKHDDINAVLSDIEEISGRLNRTVTDFYSERQKLNLILDNIYQAVLALDRRGMICACNKTAEEYFGLEFEGPVLMQNVIRDKKLLDSVRDATEKNEFITFDTAKPDGEIFEIRLFPVLSEKIQIIVAAQNVTDIRKTAIEKQEFFANAGHELNTPLSSVIGYSEMLLAETDKKKSRVFTETINKEATRMKLLIEDMLKISEMEESKEIVEEKFDLKPLVEEVITAVRPKAENKKIALTASLDSCIVLANPEKITEVAINLIDNAIKYTNEGGRVEVRLTAAKNEAVFCVKDSGIGIPQKSLSRVFERFYRVDKGRSKTEGGTGLGLSIVKHICNRYNAPIKIQSRENIGTEISVIFQLAK